MTDRFLSTMKLSASEVFCMQLVTSCVQPVFPIRLSQFLSRTAYCEYESGISIRSQMLFYKEKKREICEAKICLESLNYLSHKVASKPRTLW